MMTDEKTQKRIHAQWQRIRKAHMGNQPATMITLARDFVAEHPDCGPAWKILGTALAEMAEYRAAEEALRRAIALCPPESLWVPLAEMGHLHKAQGSYRPAAAWYRKAIEASPDEASGHIYLGSLLARAGRPSEAEAEFRAATECKMGCIDEAFLSLGLVLRSIERYEEAAECFKKAIELDPKYKEAKVALRDVVQAIAIQGTPA